MEPIALACGCISEAKISLEDIISLIVQHLNLCSNETCALRRSTVRCFGWSSRRSGLRRMVVVDATVGDLWKYNVSNACPTIGLAACEHMIIDVTVLFSHKARAG